MPDPAKVAAFRVKVCAHYTGHGRTMPWRETVDPWAILVSEIMLQQTQVARVLPAYERFLAAFPTPDALAAAPLQAVLREWKGLGYNRRAVALRRAAEEIVERHGGRVPADPDELRALPGVGPTTAAGVMAFAFGRPGLYVETNVRAALIHDFFPHSDDVRDRELEPVFDAVLDRENPRAWLYALMDYGAHLKRTLPNPSRRSAHYARQSPFEGSRRQKRSRLLQAVMAQPGLPAEELAAGFDIDISLAEELLSELEDEGFLRSVDGRYSIA